MTGDTKYGRGYNIWQRIQSMAALFVGGGGGGEGTYVSLLLNTLNISFDLVDNIYLKVVSLEMSIGSLK